MKLRFCQSLARFALGVACGAVATQVTWSDVDSGDKKDFEGLEIQLVAEKKALQSAEPFSVGLHIRHHAGFHTYWKNPGIVGVPTQIEWQLPEGFKAGPIEWPTPELTKMAIYPVYGYEREVLLPITITPPKGFEASKSEGVLLKAKTAWMCCAKTCHPGFTTLSLEIPCSQPTSQSADTKWARMFAQERKNAPVASDAWVFEAKREGDQVHLILSPVRSAKANSAVFDHLDQLYFFSGDGLIDSPSEQSFRKLQGSDKIVVALNVSEFASELTNPSQAPRLKGVANAPVSWVKNTESSALIIDIPLKVNTKDHK